MKEARYELFFFSEFNEGLSFPALNALNLIGRQEVEFPQFSHVELLLSIKMFSLNPDLKKKVLRIL